MAPEEQLPFRSIRRAAALVLAGLLVQLAASFYWRPGTFIVAAVVGVPLVLLGSVVFLRAVVRLMKRKGVL